MKLRFLAISLGLFCVGWLRGAESTPVTATAVPAKQPVLVSVHGAGAGGWQFKKVATILEAKGWKVYRPSMSGLGEHFNTALPTIGLATHIDDIVNFILFEDLHDVILLGHSYGGIGHPRCRRSYPGARIMKLVASSRKDAFVPENGEEVSCPSVKVRRPPDREDGEGRLHHPELGEARQTVPHRRAPPDGNFHRSHRARKNQDGRPKIPTTYDSHRGQGQKTRGRRFLFRRPAQRRARGWPVIDMEGDHVVAWHQPEATARH